MKVFLDRAGGSRGVGASSDPFDAFDHTFDHTLLQLAYCSLLARTFSGFKEGGQSKSGCLFPFFISSFTAVFKIH